MGVRSRNADTLSPPADGHPSNPWLRVALVGILAVVLLLVLYWALHTANPGLAGEIVRTVAPELLKILRGLLRG